MADNFEVTPGSGALIALDELSTINGESAPAGLKVQRIKAGFGVDGDLRDVSASDPMPITDANTQAILQAIGTLNDTMLTVLAAILEKMPRVTGNDQAAVSVEGTATVALATNQTLTTLTNANQVGSKYTSGDNLNLAGVQHLYNNIIVS